MKRRKGTWDKICLLFHFDRAIQAYIIEFLILLGISLVMLAFIAMNNLRNQELVYEEPEVFPLEISYIEKEVKKEEKKEEKEIELSYEDKKNISLLAHLVFAESGGCSRQTQIATASVVLNRVKSKIYPNTIRGVIYDKGQYSCTWSGGIRKKPSKLSVDVATYVYLKGSQIPKNVLYQAQFKQGGGVWKKMEGLYFCYAKK